jgi:hypothetical protein
MLPGAIRPSAIECRVTSPKAKSGPIGHSGLLFLLGGLLIAVNDKRQLRRVPCSRGRHLSRSFASRKLGSVC